MLMLVVLVFVVMGLLLLDVDDIDSMVSCYYVSVWMVWVLVFVLGVLMIVGGVWLFFGWCCVV